MAEGEIGELAARGPYTIRGYLAAPERNREAFTAEGFYVPVTSCGRAGTTAC